ncbi:MAG: cupin domain-containing protein [Steroidobacteraceae bacterium]
MRITKEQIPAKINIPGAIARQAVDFGDATGFGKISAEYFSLGAGTDIAPLLKGLKDDACQAPHWGYMLAGELVVTYTNGKVDTCKGNDIFYWPPGHSVRVVQDSEVILFSPQHEHTQVMNHMLRAMQGPES